MAWWNVIWPTGPNGTVPLVAHEMRHVVATLKSTASVTDSVRHNLDRTRLFTSFHLAYTSQCLHDCSYDTVLNKDLYELCKTLQEDLHKEKLFNDALDSGAEDFTKDESDFLITSKP